MRDGSAGVQTQVEALGGQALSGPERRRAVLHLALPIIGGMASQNVLNLVDTAMVGVLGAEALAAVGLGSIVNFLCSAFVTGLSAGVQALVARRVGEGRQQQAAWPLNAGLLLALQMAVPWSALLFWAAPHIFPWLSDDAAVRRLGTPYLQIRLTALLAMGCNFAFRGYWSAVGRSGLYLRTLVIMHLSNALLNWVLIFGKLGMPALGVRGAALASAIATYIGTGLYLLWGLQYARETGFLRGGTSGETRQAILRLSLPACLQQGFFAGGMTAFLWVVGRLGTEALAVTHVLLNLLLIGILPGLGFGIAAASFVGQSLGRGSAAEARAWVREVARMAFALVALLTVPAIIAPDWVLAPFLHESATRALASGPMRLVAIFLSLDTVGMVWMHAQIGAGDTRRMMWVSMTLQWCLFLPAAYAVGPLWGWGLGAVWVAHVVYRQIQMLVFGGLWRSGAWAKVAV
ncbi:MAG: MATE family efflux transporter [Polyangiales bacterium]